MIALLVALGGALGTLLRYGVNVACAERWALASPALPIATFTVNALGSCALGFLSPLLMGRSLWGVPLGLIVGTGVLGGFTTYSSFNLELLRMLHEGHVARALTYAGLTFIVCLTLGALGWILGARMAH
jgi:CrcB protein